MKKKLLIVFCLAGLLAANLIQAVEAEKIQNDRENASSASTSLDSALEEQIRTLEAKAAERDLAEQDVKDTMSAFVRTLYTAPSDQKYGQIPAVKDYLTDAGIRSLLFQMDPGTYSDVTNDQIQEIRSTEPPSGEKSELDIRSCSVYVNLDDDEKSADAMLLVVCSFNEEKEPAAVNIVLSAKLVDEDGWKISSISEFQQL